MCRNKVVLGICPDEIPPVPLLLYAKHRFINESVDLVGIPRINLFTDLTEEKARSMYTGFRPQMFLWDEPKNEFGWHCWPDYQMRLYKNVDSIRWGGGVHGGVVGENMAHLPADPSIALVHIKSVEHQERILKLYDKLGTNV